MEGGLQLRVQGLVVQMEGGLRVQGLVVQQREVRGCMSTQVKNISRVSEGNMLLAETTCGMQLRSGSEKHKKRV